MKGVMKTPSDQARRKNTPNRPTDQDTHSDLAGLLKFNRKIRAIVKNLSAADISKLIAVLESDASKLRCYLLLHQVQGKIFQVHHQAAVSKN